MFDVPCGGADVLRVIKFVWILLDIVLLVVPIGLILMIVLDFGKNVIAGREDEMKKGLGVAIKRIIFCVCLFLVQPFCEFVIEFVNGPDTDKANPGALQCLNIAINEDDFSKYEIDYDEINNNNNNGNNDDTTGSEDSENDTTETTDKNNANIKPNKPSKEENK
jgi:uncharacterized membrane protein